MAGSRTYRTKAIVLDETKLKETDLILTLVDQTGSAGPRGGQRRGASREAALPPSANSAARSICCWLHGRSLTS
ncbi:MAG: hypothetical protein ACLTSX_14190 [Collinsella sp.]